MEKKRPKTKLRTDDEIVKVDARTFYIRDYMIYNSSNIGWTCDCMDFVYNLEDNKGKECKHIVRVKKEFKIT